MSSLEDDNSVAGITKSISALPLSRKIYSSYTQSDTDTAGSDSCYQPPTVINSSSKTGSSISHKIRQKRRPTGGYHSDNSPAKGAILPPIGVFWDIENCQVPRGRSAVCIAQLIRDLFFDGFREAEFIVVCDVKKETNQVVQELCDAQVNLIHVSSTSKNAADEKLRQCMRRFADTHGAPSAIILISGDVNFAADLSDLRHRKKIHVILLHKQNVSKALILCASEHHCFTELTDNVPTRPLTNKNAAASPCSSELVVTNLPVGHEATRVKARLRQLSDNCGGRVARLDAANGTAVMRFTNDDQALRAQKRMDGEDVFGNKICATHFSPLVRYGCDAARWDSPNKLLAARKYRHELLDMDEGYQTMASTASWAPMPPMPQFANRANAAQPANWSTSADVSHPHMCLNPAMQQVYNAMPVYFGCAQTMSPTGVLPACTQPPPSWFNEKIYHEKDDACRSRSGSFSQVTPDAVNGKIRGDAAFDYSAPSGSAFSRAASQPWTIPKHSTANRSDISNVNRPSSSSPWQHNVQSHASVNSSGNSSDTENYFKPIQKSEGVGPVELHVSNLDQTIDQAAMQKMLLAMFKEFVNVLHLQMHMLNDGTLTASVKVPSKQDAQYAISQMHRRRIGFKRIMISYASGNETANLQLLKSHVMALLQTIPGHSLPLFKFRELFEARYLVSVSLSDMYKMRDICTIKEDAKGRLVSLNPEHRDTPSPQLAGQENEQPFCVLHCKIGIDKCWAVQTATTLPNVFISIRELSERLNKLLKSHSGSVPLPSLAVCYEADLGLSLSIDDKTGVPLEHLVSCCPGVTIRQGVSGVKHLIWTIANKPNANESQAEDGSGQSPKCVSPALAHQLQQFSREVVDLLRTTAKCQVLFNKFIPAYHHHFGRQCRVADYGYTKLIDLMEALSNTVQVMGGGNRRTVTLTHRAQVKRFTSDLCRVLKTQNNKQMAVADLPAQFEKVLDRPWDITEYGVCVISDILDEVNENTIVRARLPSGDVMIGTPKHVQTTEEVRKTNVFKVEVIQLLKHAPQYSMQFNKFVPAYHHHFGHQCRVSDYGFTKLIELFEAIPDIVKVNEGSDTERFVSLVPAEALKVLEEQLEQILSVSTRPVSLAKVCSEFIQLYGYALKPELYESEDIIDLLEEFKHVKVIQSAEGIFLSLEDRAAVHRLGIRAWSVLFNNNRMKVFNFLEKYNKVYLEICDIEKLREAKDIVTVPNPSTMESVISLTPLWRFAAKALLCCERGHTPLTVFESSFYNLCRKQIDPTEYGFQNLTSLIAAIPEVLLLKERNNRKKYICVNSDLLKSGVCLPPSLPIYNNESSSSISSDAQSSSQSNNTKKRSTTDNKRKTATNASRTHHHAPQPAAAAARTSEPKLADYFAAAMGQNNSAYLDHKVTSSTSIYNDHAAKTSDDSSARNNWPPLKTNFVEPVVRAEAVSSENVRRNVASSSTANCDKNKRPREMPPGVSPLYDFFYELDLLRANAPPKPDSPSTNQDSVWNSNMWEPPSHSTTEFIVNLPPSSADAQVDMDLISPTLSLMSACPNPFAVFNSPSVADHIRNKHQDLHGSNVTAALPGLSGEHVQAPAPSELPKPSPSLVAPKKDESQQVEDIRSNVSTTPLTNSQTKRKGRIAAIFPSMEPK